MTGANYMGGKRNAARARVKDAAGNAQRAHFGKKRLEILRTSLSKRGNARSGKAKVSEGARNLPEISLAHAKRAQGLFKNSKNGQSSSTSTSSLSNTPGPSRRPPSVPDSPYNRSRILQALDADNPAAQRARVEKILQIPDLLGLSCSVPRHSRSARSKLSDVASPSTRTPVSCRTFSRKKPISRGSTVEASPGSLSGFLTSPCSAVGEQAPRRRPTPCIPQYPPGFDAGFIPMCFDSSPPAYPESRGIPEHWTNVQPHDLHDSDADFDLPEPYPPSRPTFSQVGQHDLSSVLHGSSRHIASPSQVLGSLLSVTSSLELPPTLAGLQYLSDVPPINEGRTGSGTGSSPLPPSDLSGCSWAERTSQLLHSEDISEASFSMTYEDDAEDIDHMDNMTPSWEDGHWEAFYLSDVLGELFEGADPWSVLDDILDLPVAERPWRPNGDDLGESRRSGVGYAEAAPSPPLESFTTSQTLTDDGNEGYYVALASLSADFAPSGHDDDSQMHSLQSQVDSAETVQLGMNLSATSPGPSASKSPEHHDSFLEAPLGSVVIDRQIDVGALNRADRLVSCLSPVDREKDVPAGGMDSFDDLATLRRGEDDDRVVDGPALFADEEPRESEDE